MVYPVDGGMEDWLYAAGWDKATNRQDCLGGLNLPLRRPRHLLANDTHLPDDLNRSLSSGEATAPSGSATAAENRALVFLVETSNLKVINDKSLGDSLDVSVICDECSTS